MFGRRKPSLRRALGISSFKSKITRMTGGRALRDPMAPIKNAKRNAKRSAKRMIGLEPSYSRRKTQHKSKSRVYVEGDDAAGDGLPQPNTGGRFTCLRTLLFLILLCSVCLIAAANQYGG
jgi:hypothetical protein